MLRILTPWDSQPQEAVGVDWSNPLTRGLKLAVIGGSAINIVDGRRASSVASLSESVSSEGKTWTGTTSATPVARGLVFPFDVAGALTVHAIVLRAATVADANSSRIAIVACNRNNFQTDYWNLNLGNGFGSAADDDKPRFVAASGGIGTIYSGGVALSGSNPATTALANQTWHRVSAAKPAGVADTSGTNQIVIGAERNGASVYYGLNGSIALVLLWDRELSAAEIAQLSGREYELFAPRSIWVPVSAGGGSASTITAAAGASTASTLAASSTAASTPTAAAGTATASTVAASSTAASAITSATGAATAPTLTGSAVVAGAITAAAGVGAGETLVGDTLAAGSAAIVAAGGVATTATLGGSSVAAADIGVAAGVATASVMGGPGAEQVTRMFAGGFPRREQFRKGYIIKGKRYWLTEEELAVMVAQMLAEISRGDIKQVTAGKPKTISKKTWDAIQVEARIEAVAKQFDDTDEDEDESILMML